jgi:hypothetical protein
MKNKQNIKLCFFFTSLNLLFQREGDLKKINVRAKSVQNIKNK